MEELLEKQNCCNLIENDPFEAYHRDNSKQQKPKTLQDICHEKRRYEPAKTFPDGFSDVSSFDLWLTSYL